MKTLAEDIIIREYREGDEEDIVAPEGEALLSLQDFDYRLISPTKVEITSISYQIKNGIAPMKMELLLYVFDEMDDSSQIGLVREQMSLGHVDYQQTVQDTVDISALYDGNLNSEKNIRLTLIGYVGGGSSNLVSDTQEVLFS